jgi:hypothetical protein
MYENETMRPIETTLRREWGAAGRERRMMEG